MTSCTGPWFWTTAFKSKLCKYKYHSIGYSFTLKQNICKHPGIGQKFLSASSVKAPYGISTFQTLLL